MDSDAYLASQAAYGSEIHHERLLHQGYQVDRNLSTKNIRTYTKKGNTLVALRGTNLPNLSDLEADKDIFFGTTRTNPQFMQAAYIAKKARQKYGKVTVTGHSLGGTKAIHAANKIGAQAIVFNPGTGINPLFTGNHTVYRKDKDPISSRTRGKNIRISAGGHSLSDFEPMFSRKWK